MKNVLFLVIGSLLPFSAFAMDIGTMIKPKISPDGHVQLGVMYTVSGDPSGLNYLLTMTPDLPATESGHAMLMNYYFEESDSLANPWTESPSVVLGSLQIREKQSMIVEALISGAKELHKKSYIVFSADGGKTISYNISISDLCKLYPSSFENLTDGTECAK